MYVCIIDKILQRTKLKENVFKKVVHKTLVNKKVNI